MTHIWNRVTSGVPFHSCINNHFTCKPELNSIAVKPTVKAWALNTSCGFTALFSNGILTFCGFSHISLWCNGSVCFFFFISHVSFLPKWYSPLCLILWVPDWVPQGTPAERKWLNFDKGGTFEMFLTEVNSFIHAAALISSTKSCASSRLSHFYSFHWSLCCSLPRQIIADHVRISLTMKEDQQLVCLFPHWW